jgi:2-keto-4-pentenoate hydratase/2-oxohepta-3-ene-1,7-dioic acid hydratase in catechol pathway
MKLARIRTGAAVHLARVESSGFVLLATESDHPAADVLRETLADGIPTDGVTIAPEEIEILSPIARPSKFLAIGLNYRDHARETGAALPEAPLIFMKSPTTIVGPTDRIEFDPLLTAEVDHEAELGVVIGRRCRGVDPDEALDHVLGYTIVNDVSARDLQLGDGQWTRGKSLDTFGPVGPFIVGTDELGDGSGLRVRCLVNGEVRQDGTTDDFVFGVAQVVSHISKAMALEPGDLIATGTPAGVGFTRTPPLFLANGDILETEIERIGRLRNELVSRPTPT